MARSEFPRWLALLACVVLPSSAALADEVEDVFHRFDKNGDGRVTREELPEDLRPNFDRVDANHDGWVSLEEHRALAERNRNRPGGQRAQAGGQPRIPDNVRAELDLPYAATENPQQRLDVYVPKNASADKPLPLVVFIHGGGWQNGDKRGGAQALMAAATGNYVGASINYRLTDEAAWPAQIHDCKAAIRWLRANAAKYHIDPERIGVIGSSAGGHLVAMLGVTGGVEALEGSLGEHSGVSSRVACVVDLYGPTDLTDMPEREARRPGSPVAKLVGGPVQDRRETAREASPVTYVSSDDPPMLIIHGTADPTVPFDQSTRLEKALKAAGVSVLLVPVTDGVHGRFNTPEFPRRVQQFFDKQLRGEDIQVSAEPIKAGPEQPAPQK